PSGLGRTNSQGLRRYQDHRDPISELLNIDNCERSEAIQKFFRGNGLDCFVARAPRNEEGET
ncbi:hypothetical protein, partial [Bradyrhizobium sp. 153]|uniref:hypothetical protein n=1 Tax=Bradyrhizobium sp. 153 TaxID=2782627 RepID=UPI001FFA0FC2